MQLTVEIPDTTVEVVLNVIYIRNGQKDLVTGMFLDPEENDYVDMMPKEKLQ